VKAGLAVATLGSDTGGSVRLPASYTGIVGLKPTYGAVSRFGLVAFASSLDQVGPMAATAEDCAVVFSAISGRDEHDSTCANRPPEDALAAMKAAERARPRIGIPKEYLGEGLQPEVRAALDKVVAELMRAGHEVREVSLPHTDYSVAVYYIVAVSEASTNLSRFDGVRFGTRLGGGGSLVDMYRQTRTLFGEEVKRRIILGTYSLSSGYYDAYYKKACQARRLIKNDFDRAFEQVDLLLGPVAPTTAFKLGEKTQDPLKMYLNDILTIPASLAGVPAVAVPAGRDAAGLPIGVQFIGRHFAEAEVLAAASFVETHVHREVVDHGI
jgi:aspartyl-tRNA(Asn)/glutamyl-tRNA(Gln) amidotransferase subunit A